MMAISRDEKIKLLEDICKLLDANKLDYLVYGSLGYQLLTGNQGVFVRDIDIIIKQADFPRLIEVLPSLLLNPIQTPFSIHANSKIFLGEDNKPFDVSFDSYEHYFAPRQIDLSRYRKVDLGETSVRVMTVRDLIRMYEVGLEGSNSLKIEEYKDKINKLRSLSGK